MNVSRECNAPFLLVLCLTLVSAVQAEGADTFEQCEGALKNLVAILETRGEFSEANRVERLPDDEHAFSNCLIPVVTLESGEEVNYVLSRSSDDVTVFVLRAPILSSTLKLYGPFYSAYRK